MNPQPPANPSALALAAGQLEAFAALYDRLGRPLYRVAYAVLGRREDAEDAVQDVFVSLARSREGLARARDVDAYVFASLRNALGQRLARRAAERGGLREVASSLRDARCAAPEVREDWDAILSC